MKKNKSKIVIIICESKNNCTEKQYFNYIQKYERDLLNYDLFILTMGMKFEVNKFIDRLKFCCNPVPLMYLIIKDNDINQSYFDENQFTKDLTQTIKINYKKDEQNKINGLQILFCGIPTNKFSFDHFLLFHFPHEIVLKEKKDPITFLKKEINEKYKCDEKSIKKIFDKNKNWKSNIFSNSKCDRNYIELINIIFKS